VYDISEDPVRTLDRSLECGAGYNETSFSNATLCVARGDGGLPVTTTTIATVATTT